MTDKLRNRVYNFLNEVDDFLSKVDKFLHKHIDPRFWTIISVLAIVLIVLVVVEVADNTSGVTDDNDIAQRLGDAGWVLFTLDGCGACEAQKDIIGDSSSVLLFECDASDEALTTCLVDYKIEAVPTWINFETHERLVGVQNQTQLEVMINE